MFDKLKQINELRKLQGEFAKEKLTVEKRGVFITMNGSMDVEAVKLNSALSIEDQQEALKEALSQAKHEMQKKMAQKMMASGMGF